MILAIAGVLIVGGAAAFGVVQLVEDDGGAQQSAEAGARNGAGTEQGDRGSRRQAPVNPANVTVAVLNGTTVPGLAAQVGDRVRRLGFELGTVANSPDQGQQRAESVVMFTPGAAREAAVVSRRLRIPQRERINPAAEELAGNASVVVIAGQDRTQ